MDEKSAESFVFLLSSDGTFAWANTEIKPTGENSETGIGEAAWNHCGPGDEDRFRDLLAKLMFDHPTSSFPTIIKDIDGKRILVSMDRLPIVQSSQYAVVGWCRPLSDEVLSLTNREKEVLKLVCDELTSEQIAKLLHISPATVETHRQNIAKKLGTSSVVGQVRAAIRGGLVDP